ncbi:hypothetical protein [Chondromyces apiculatus]|nr:hypothetical protein [Chondromyces apiculatus]
MSKENQGSFYTLELHVSPGGARRGDCFVVNDLAAVKEILSRDLGSGSGVYLVGWYGESILLSVYVPGEARRTIDLLPFIRLVIPGYPVLTFEDGECSFDFEEDEAAHEEEETLSYKLFGDAIRPSEVIVDWEAANVPPLPAPILPAGTEVRVHSNYLGHDREAIYGHNDFEGGDDRGGRYLDMLG